MEPGPAQVHLMPLCHLPDRNESLHNWNQGGCRVRCPAWTRITNQCQENNVQLTLALHSWTWETFVRRVVSWLRKLRKEMCSDSGDLLA